MKKKINLFGMYSLAFILNLYIPFSCLRYTFQRGQVQSSSACFKDTSIISHKILLDFKYKKFPDLSLNKSSVTFLFDAEGKLLGYQNWTYSASNSDSLKVLISRPLLFRSSHLLGIMRFIHI